MTDPADTPLDRERPTSKRTAAPATAAPVATAKKSTTTKRTSPKKATTAKVPAKRASTAKPPATKTPAKKAATVKRVPAVKAVAKVDRAPAKTRATAKPKAPGKPRATQQAPGKAPVKRAPSRRPVKKLAPTTDSNRSKEATYSTVGQLAVSLDSGTELTPATVFSGDEKPAKSIGQFVEHVLGSPPELTSVQAAERAGVTVEVARAMWRAMGFADVGSAAEFADSDVQALKALMSLVSAGYISFDESIEMVRAIGQHTSRLAEWQGNIIARSLIERGVIAQHGVLEAQDIGALFRDSEAYQPVLESLLVYAWRRQMSSNAMRAAAIAEEGPDARTGDMTVGFADLAGFTRLSRQIPEEDLARLVKQFEGVSADVVATHGSRLIKTLGDEVLFVHESPVKVARIALDLHAAHHGNSDVPRMRIGLATGPVLLRMGDVFGTTVNRASRLTAMAKPGSTFVDLTTQEVLEDHHEFLFKGVRPRPARGFGLLRAWSLKHAKATS